MSRIRDIANILSGVSTNMATDAEVTSSIASHAAAADPHTGYMLESTLTTSGDLIYASGANSPARLGIGANGTYLTSNGSVPSWGTISAGGMTLLASSVGVSGTTAVNFNSISQDYNNLIIYISDLKLSTSGSLSMRLNNDATNANYYYNTIYWTTTGTFGQTNAVPNLTLGNAVNATQTGRISFGMEITITRYASTSSENTQFYWRSAYAALGYLGFGLWTANSTNASNTAVNSVNFITTQSITDGNFYLYGVK